MKPSKRNLQRVFKRFKKLGITRAFIETTDGDFIFPPVNPNPSRFRLLAISGLISMVCMVFIVMWLYDSGHYPENLKRQSINRLNIPDSQGLTPLHRFVIAGDRRGAIQLCLQGVDINKSDHYGWTPLHWAVFLGDTQMKRLLYRFRADQSRTTTRKWFVFPAGATAADLAKVLRDISIASELKKK